MSLVNDILYDNMGPLTVHPGAMEHPKEQFMSKTNTKNTGTNQTGSIGSQSASAGTRDTCLDHRPAGRSTQTPENQHSRFGWWGFRESVGDTHSGIPQGKQDTSPPPPSCQPVTKRIGVRGYQLGYRWKPLCGSLRLCPWNILYHTGLARLILLQLGQVLYSPLRPYRAGS